MDYKNKLMTALSLVALAALSACTDEAENGGRTLPGDHSLSFAVSTKSANGWKPANGTRAASGFEAATQELEPVEMQGKVDGKTVYLTTEVTRGFPGDNTPMTRGTQININEQDKIESFGVSAYTDKDGKPDYMYNEVATKDGDLWFPKEKYYWPAGKTLSFYAWYPCTADGMTLTDETHEGAPVMTYTIPKEVKDQIDVMTVEAIGKSDPNSTTVGTELTFEHALSAVKFSVGDLPNCKIRSISLEGLKYSGSYTLGADAWNLKDDTKDFLLSWDEDKYVTGGTAGTPITADDETFFMMPQQLPADAKVIVELNDGTKDFTVSASIGGTDVDGTQKEWKKGCTYTYQISYNFVSLIVSNETFIAYTNAGLTNQVAFFLTTGANEGVTGTIISSNTAVTFYPAPTITNHETETPVYVNWPADVTEDVTLTLTLGKKTKTVVLHRETPTPDDAYYVYSVPETTSEPLGNDVLSVQNASQADWIGLTTSSTYGSNYSTDKLYNTTKGDIYLQTLSIPSTDRFASLLVEKESENVMYCVEQKTITADFGFKDCERNISREAEKWNIVLTGGRFKEATTHVKAKVVISSSVPDTQIITDLGRDLTADEPADVPVDKTTATGSAPYVKKRWDTQAETDANNGTRAVNVQILGENSNSGDWQDISGTGTMADWMTWKYFTYYEEWVVFSSKAYNNGDGTYIYPRLITPTYTQSYLVHEKHPYFGKTKWQVTRNSNNTANTPSGYIWYGQCKNNKSYPIHGRGTNSWGGTLEVNYYTYDDYTNNRILKQNGEQFIFVKGATKPSWGSNVWESWYKTEIMAVVPIIQNLAARPDNDNPITESVDE